MSCSSKVGAFAVPMRKVCYVVTSKVDNWSFRVVQRRLINVLDGVASVLILLQRRHLPLESLDPFGLLTILEAFGP